MGRIAVGAAMACLLFAGTRAHGQGYSVAGSGSGTGASASGAETAPAASGSASAGSSASAAPARDTHQSRNSVRAPRQPGEYGGLVPGSHVPPRLARGASTSRRRASDPVIVEWPGFQMRPEGSRVFLAVSAPPTVVPETAPGRLVYRVRNARVPVRNNRRTLETAAFNTPVQRAFLRQRGRDVELVIELRTQMAPQVSQETNAQGPSYVNIDFPVWTPPDHAANVLLPAASSGIRLSAEPQGGDEPPPSANGSDPERPPPAQPGN